MTYHLREVVNFPIDAIDFKNRLVLASIDSLAKQGLYDTLGIPIKVVLNDLRDDPDEHYYEITNSYVLNMLQNGFALDGSSFVVENSPFSNLEPVEYVPDRLPGHLLELSEDKLYIHLSPLERKTVSVK